MFQVVQNWFSPTQLDRLKKESEGLHSEAEPLVVAQCAVRGGQFWGACRFRYASAGPVLLEVHKDDRLVSLMADLAGRPMIPTRASYIYYGEGDFLGPHVDHADACSYAAIIPVSESVEPLEIYPEMMNVRLDDLREKVISGSSLGEPRQVEYPTGGMLIFHGSSLPHSRPPAQTPCRIATVCFSAEQ